MSKFLMITSAVSALLLTTMVCEAQAQLTPEALKKLNLSGLLACKVQGTPSEFPDDLYLTNNSSSTVPAGTTVQWSVPSIGKKGNHTLAGALAPGGGVAVSGVLTGGVEAGTPCIAKAM